VADGRVSGIEIAEQSGADHAIDRVPTAVAAFVGRTLKGPRDRPVVITSFLEFQHIFGGLWQPSPLSYAIEQFFENGGRTAYVVRVVNGARPPTITLPTAGAGVLVLIGLNPGTREFLRASVDYDGIGENEPDRFNVVIQRVRLAGSELIEDQEIHRRVSIDADATRFISDVLLESRLMRVTGPIPRDRPSRSARVPNGPAVGYVSSNADADDGAPLSDYDVIGSAAESTGIFALKDVAAFNFLCIPPLAREQDIGLSTLLVAARFCRDRHAMLIVDPPASWHNARVALTELRSWPFRSENALMYYPRLLAVDRLRGRVETFASCGAVAGMMARSDETWPVWSAAEGEEVVLRSGLRPAVAVTESERQRFAQAGVNTLQSVRAGTRDALSLRTLAAGSSGAPDWKYLSARRLALFITASLERGTRWMLFEHNGPVAWRRAEEQVGSFLGNLHEQGAFAGSRPDESYFVICDDRVNTPESVADGKFKLLFGYAVTRPGDFHAMLITHQAGASRVRHVTPNRSATSQRRLEWEIETSILRGTSLPSLTF